MGLRMARKKSSSCSGDCRETRNDDRGLAKVEGRTGGASDEHEEDNNGMETLCCTYKVPRLDVSVEDGKCGAMSEVDVVLCRHHRLDYVTGIRPLPRNSASSSKPCGMPCAICDVRWGGMKS